MKESRPTGGTNRREFIQQMALCFIAAQLPLTFFGCKSEEEGFVGSGKPPYKVWEEMLMALKTSPDHLEGRMKILIDTKDPEAMFHFVRDDIYLIPPKSTSMTGMGKIMRYGKKGVLRYGFATPREKAELLHKMYRDAGITSKIVYERTDIKPESVPAFFFRPKDRKLEPKVNQKMIDRWEKELKTDVDETKLIQIDDSEKESQKLAEQLWNLLPEKDQLKPFKFDFRWDNYRTPSLVFTSGQDTKYAHLFDPTVPFGDLRDGGTTTDAEETQYTDENVEMTLTTREGINPNDEIELISGSWLLNELAGNQLSLVFANGLSLEQKMVTPIGNLRLFTPTLSFQSFDEDLDYMAERSFIGNAITLEADIIDLKSEEPKLNGKNFLAKPNPDLQKKVKEIDIKAVPRMYPFVKLEVSPTDENNKVVEGLSTSDFTIFDNDAPVSAIMENNQRTPKITMLYDTSGSMPNDYSGKNIDLFIENLERDIKSKYPSVTILKWKTDSNLFTSLYKASKQDADVIIYITDGDNNDNYNSDWETVYNEGPPALMLNVYNSTSKHVKGSFEKMAKSTSGLVLDAKDQVEVITKIGNFLANIDIPPYVFTYYASGKEKEHKVEISIDEKRLNTNTNYKFSMLPTDDMILGKQLAGLYLTLKIGTQKIHRVLAGWDPLIDFRRKPCYSDFKAVRSLILGGTLISVEGEGPTMANTMADILKYKLSNREFGEAMLDGKIAEAKIAFEKGSYNYNTSLASLMQPLQHGVTQNSLTFASGPRIAIIKNRIGLEEKTTSISFDYLPTSNYVTLAENPEDGFRITLQKTAQLALLEKSLFPENTFSHLQNKTLLERSLAIEQKWFKNPPKTTNPDFWYEKIYRGSGHFKIFDQSASVKSYWQIDAASGELFGVLEDGTGGGIYGFKSQLEALNNVMAAYREVIKKLGMKPEAMLDPIHKFGKTLVRLTAFATEAIIIMNPPQMEQFEQETFAELACFTYRNIVISLFKGGGIGSSGLEHLIGSRSGNTACDLT